MRDKTEPPPDIDSVVPTAVAPWSHQWLDELGLKYHEAIAQKIRVNPSLRQVAVANIDRWLAQNEYPQRARESLLQWRRLVTTAPLDELLGQMLDTSEKGDQLRQNTPFPGVLSPEERRAIRQRHEEASI